MPSTVRTEDLLAFVISPKTTDTAKFVLSLFTDRLKEFYRPRGVVADRFEPRSSPELASLITIVDLLELDDEQLLSLQKVSPRWSYFVNRLGEIRRLIAEKDAQRIQFLLDDSKALPETFPEGEMETAVA